MALGLASRFAGSKFAEKYKLNKPTQKIAYLSTKTGFKVIGKAARAFNKTGNPNHQGTRLQSRKNNLFDLSLNEEQQIIRDSVKRFAQQELRPKAYQADKEAILDEAVFNQVLELGLNYLSIPESQGGTAIEYTPITSALIAEDMAWGDLSMAYTLLSPVAVANAISRWGNQSQQQSYLPSFVGETPPKAAIAIQEPQALFDPMKLATQAVKSGSGYKISGEKTLIPFAGEAELYLVAAEYKGKPRLFIIEAGTAGLSWANSPAMGLKAAQTGRLKLDKVLLTKEALLGDDDFDYQAFIDLGKLHWCAMAVGCCQAVLDYVIPYCNERTAFGEPVSHRQSVAFMVADIAIEVESMRLLLWRATSRAEQGLDFHREAFLAHSLCADKSMAIATNGVQLLGGHGYTKEHPVERWYRDLRAVSINHGLHL